MNTELVTDLMIQDLLKHLDTNRQGAFIEVGLGNVNYGFLWATKLGFKCYGVEPLPSVFLQNMAKMQHVDLTEAAISKVTGEMPIYIGNMHDRVLSDISSLHPDWWGAGDKTKMIRSLNLVDFLKHKSIGAISCLKIDTEGSELLVISELFTLQLSQLPQIIVFEYGGGGIKSRQEGAWKRKFFNNTLECLDIVKRLGYSVAIVIEQNADLVKRFDLSLLSNFEDMFLDEARVGNILCSRTNITARTISQLTRRMRIPLARDAIRNWVLGFRDGARHYGCRIFFGVKRRVPGFSKKVAAHEGSSSGRRQ
jgi:FkbM family methyltransferase